MKAMGIWALAVLAMFAAGASLAQGRFDTVIEVGDEVVTRYQVDQRTLFLSLLRAPGDVRALAREQLINETLQLSVARQEGIEPDPRQIAAGIDEFAARANLTGEEFVAALAQNGVQPETFRDFITAGVAWRSYVREILGEDARDIDPYSLRLEYVRTGTQGGLRVNLTEIVLPAADPATAEASRVRADELSRITDPEEFAAAARVFSIAGSAGRGGEVGWRAIEALPQDIQGILSRQPAGTTTRPINRENSIAIYHVSDRAEVAAGRPSDPVLDYALLGVTGASEAGTITARVDTCDDLYGVAKRRGGAGVFRESAPRSSLPATLRQAADSLDEGEAAFVTVSDGPALMMLCERGLGGESTADYDIIGNRILNQRLSIAASGTLTDLRARTYIRVLD